MANEEYYPVTLPCPKASHPEDTKRDGARAFEVMQALRPQEVRVIKVESQPGSLCIWEVQYYPTSYHRISELYLMEMFDLCKPQMSQLFDVELDAMSQVLKVHYYLPQCECKKNGTGTITGVSVNPRSISPIFDFFQRNISRL